MRESGKLISLICAFSSPLDELFSICTWCLVCLRNAVLDSVAALLSTSNMWTKFVSLGTEVGCGFPKASKHVRQRFDVTRSWFQHETPGRILCIGRSYGQFSSESIGGHAVEYLVRSYSSSQKAAGLIPGETTGFLNSPHSPNLGSTHCPRVSTRNLMGAKQVRRVRLRNLTAICEQAVYEMWKPRRLTSLWNSNCLLQEQLYHFTDLIEALQDSLDEGSALAQGPYPHRSTQIEGTRTDTQRSQCLSERRYFMPKSQQ